MSWAVPLGFFVPILAAIVAHVLGIELTEPAWAVVAGVWAVTFMCGIFVGSYDARHR